MTKLRSTVEVDLRKYLDGSKTEKDFIYPDTEVADIISEAECRTDIVRRGQGNPGALRILCVILGYYGPEVYKKIAPLLGEGTEVYEKFTDFVKQSTKEGKEKKPTLFDFIRASFNIDLPDKK